MAAKSSKGKKTTRKLTAILSADVAGYSRLMGDDEARREDRGGLAGALVRSGFGAGPVEIASAEVGEDER